MVETVAGVVHTANLLGSPEQYQAFLSHKKHVVQTIGRAASRLVRNFSWKNHKENAVITIANTLHYYTDETVGFLGYQYLKASLDQQMSYATSTAVALGTETLALGGIAYALGRANLAVREKSGKTYQQNQEKSNVEKSVSTLALGVPFSTQINGLDRGEILRHTIHPFMTSNALFVGIAGAGVDLAGTDKLTLLVAGGLLAKNVAEGLYDSEQKQAY